MNGDGPAIELRGLTKRYGKSTAVDSIDLSVPCGATLGLLGPNGAGKSTTLRMMLGLLRPTSGDMRVLGMDVMRSRSEVKQRVGYVPEAHYIYRWMSVDAVLQFARACYRTWNADLCAELLDMFDLPRRKRVGQLSKGMLAKLSLVVALAHEPDLLVLDEPLSGLDPVARDEFLDGVLKGICGGKRTVMFSSHQLDDVNRLADEVAIMNSGRILVHCPLDELLRSTKRVRAVLQNGRLPQATSDAIIWQHVNRREWEMTIHPYADEIIERLRADNPVSNLEVIDLGLDDIFKDFIRGQRQAESRCQTC
jgi:ABC-2 type transport system ATP-binding protein